MRASRSVRNTEPATVWRPQLRYGSRPSAAHTSIATRSRRSGTSCWTNPRFERASLLRLAESLGDVGHWRGRCPWTEEVHLVKKHYKAEVSLAQAILRADEVDAYVYMNDVQRDPEFATLVDACFSCLQAADRGSGSWHA